jgi:hypothetical protein
MTALPLAIPLSILNTALPLVFFRARAIGVGSFFAPFGVIPNATLEETHRDAVRITDHPVEQNAPITDHAYKMPVEVTIRAGWSNSSLQAVSGLAQGIISGSFLGLGGSATYIDQVYQTLLAMQIARAPLVIFTGKRRYKNMLIEDITVRTDQRTENSLMADIRCREIIIVSTSVTSLPAPSGNGFPENMGNPQNNAIEQNTGVQQLQPNPPSFNVTAFGNALGL